MSCLKNLINKSYISNITEITSMNILYNLLIEYHNEYYKFYKSMPTVNILPFWRRIFDEFIKSNHKSLYKEPPPPDYTQEIDFKQYTYNTDIARILDTYEIGVKSYIYKFMPTKIQYIVLFLTSSEYSIEIKYMPETKGNVVEINDSIIKFIGDNYNNRIKYTKSIIKNFCKVYFYLNQNRDAKLEDETIIQAIKKTNYNSEDIDDYNEYY